SLADLHASRGPRYRLRTDDQAAAHALLATDPRVRELSEDGGDLVFGADEAAVFELSRALVGAGLGIGALVPETATLEHLLVVLTFASRFGAQLATALVAGDIVANEDAGGTLKMLFTRSARRAQLLTGKTLTSFTYVAALLLTIIATGMISGIAAWGFNPVV